MKVIVAIDGSDQSRAIALTLLALSPFDQILLLYTISLPQLAYPGTGMSVGHDFSQRAEEALRVEGTRILDDMESNLPQGIGTVHTHIELGPAAETILSVSEQEHADLIIVGSRGLGMIREHVLGSVSHRVLTHSGCSTLVVKTGVDRFKHVLLPIEHKEEAELAVSFLTTQPFRGNVQITLLHVIPFAQPVLPMGALLPEAWRKDLFADAERFTGELAPRLSSLGYLTSTIVDSGDPSFVIREQAHRLQPDLIMVGTKKPGILNRFLIGSVSHSIIHHSSCPVLLVKYEPLRNTI